MSKKFKYLLILLISTGVFHKNYSAEVSQIPLRTAFLSNLSLSTMLGISSCIGHYVAYYLRTYNGQKLTESENKYYNSIIAKYKLPNNLTLSTSNMQNFGQTFPEKNQIILKKNFIEDYHEFFTEYVLLHEFGHLHTMKKAVLNSIKKTSIYLSILYLVLKLISNKNSIPANKYLSSIFITTFASIFILKNFEVENENMADKFALEKIKYNNTQDYDKLIKNLESELNTFQNKFKFLSYFKETSFVKRLFWFFYDNYIFPPDAIKILEKKRNSSLNS